MHSSVPLGTGGRREKRAMNRIRKRKAELELLTGDERVGVGGDEGREQSGGTNGRQKRKRSGRGEVDAVEGREEEGKQSEATQQTNKIELSSTANDPLALSSAAAADHLLEQARALGNELRSKLAERQPPSRGQAVQVRLQLDKLQGNSLSEREFAAFIHRAMLGSHNGPRMAGANWLRFEGKAKPLQYLVVRVNCEDKTMLKTSKDAEFIDNYFQRRWIPLSRSICDKDKFWKALGIVVQSRHELLIRKIKTSGDPLLALRRSERKPKLLMSLEQMVQAKYPFPSEPGAEQAEEGGKKRGGEPKIKATRGSYRKVGEHSPVLVLDCEMCYTTSDRLELTRISVVNEEGEKLMDTLVKPHNKITNYLTHKSGITEQLLKNVTTRLKEVQYQFCALLKEDTILCGHSLENDLEALQLSHPFCIDTSLLFNLSGRLHIRTGLKALAKILLNVDIQMDPIHGHCSLEDARTTLRLLQLKLDRGLQFGNVALGWNFVAWAKENGMTITGSRITSANVLECVRRDGDEKKEEADELLDLEADCTVAGSSTFTSSILEVDSTTTTTRLEEITFGEGEQNGAAEVDVEGTLGPSAELLAVSVEQTDEERRSRGGSSPAPREEAEEAAYQCQYFDFADAVRIDNAMQKIAQLSDCFRLVNEGKRARRMLVAMPQPEQYFGTNPSCSLFDLSGSESDWLLRPFSPSSQKSEAEDHAGPFASKPQAICSQISRKLIEYDFIFLELDCPKGTPKRELDDAFKALSQGVCNNGMVFLLVTGGRGKSGKAILYQKVHRKPDERGHAQEEGAEC